MSEQTLKQGSILFLDPLKERSAWLFEDPCEIVTCSRLEDVETCLARLEEAQAKGLFAAGYLAYELGFAFEEKLRRRFEATGDALLWFGLYDRRQDLSLNVARALLAAAKPAGGRAGRPRFDMDYATYKDAFATVQDHLAKGNAYQVNLTLRAAFDHSGAPEHLFLDLLRRQPVEFAAFLRLEDRTVLSLSPELFLERKGKLLRARPMKGTAARGRTPAEDVRIVQELAGDPKQRAENTVIVDLMRNDLSRIAQTGSVRVTRLCEVERSRSLHQMTSTIEADMPPGIGFARIVQTLFPCGSVTGAPKLSAMQIAHDLETGPRGIHGGAIGYLAPGGDFRLNVANRTLVLHRDGSGEAGAGSGIVFHSGAAPDYDERAPKLDFLSDRLPDFELIETMAFDPSDGFLLLERHLLRLRQSAAYFGFRFEEAAVRAALHRESNAYAGPQRVRLLLNADGKLSVTAMDLTPTDRTSVFTLALAEEPTHSSDRFLYHKTTNRAFYDETRARHQAESGCQEVLFTNENGFLTEGSYMTLFLKKNGRLFTPALGHGLLPGTLRAGLLERNIAVEADLTWHDLVAADDILVGNSVRGLVRARLAEGARF